MNLKKPENSNYCANVCKITNIIDIENCDNVSHGLILGNLVIVSNDSKKDDIGIYFPLETKLSTEFLSNNNLYRKKELNVDQEKAGYFEENGRIRCVKFRGNKSEGFFIPLNSLNFTSVNIDELKVGNEFDEIGGIKICEKYIVIRKNMAGNSNSNKTNNRVKRFNRLIENQVRLHVSTGQLYKNTDKIKPESLISITKKLHGTSGVSTYILIKRQLNIVEKILLLIRKWCES